MILSLLRSQNRCIEKLLRHSQEFANHSGEVSTPQLEVFERGRDSAMKAYELLDRKLTDVVITLDDADRTPNLLEDIKRELDQKQKLLNLLEQIDLRVVARIQAAQVRLEKEIATSRKSKAVLGKFKSGSPGSSGEGFDTKL